MKGIVLAGGTGSRLFPLTKSINKHCLPIYDRPMVYYPIQTLVKAGITDIILVAGGNHMSQFIDLLGDGSDLDCHISYVAQMKPGGIAEAISLVEPFIDDEEEIIVILGDNIFAEDIRPFVSKFANESAYREQSFNPITRHHCHVVCTLVPGSEAVNYGVLCSTSASAEEHGQLYIKEKPAFPAKMPDEMFKAVTGLYMYTADVFSKIRHLRPSDRGELEVSELNDLYAATGDLSYSVTTELWLDCGVNIDHMLECSQKVKELSQ